MEDQKHEYRYIFGPVMSRRLGRSLGIDLTPFKTCSLNCIYCECGPTTNLTIHRDEFFPVREVISELTRYLKSSPDIDVITFSGSGEPTLHSGIGEIIRWLKKNTNYPVCVLTNGTLLYQSEVQMDLMDADIVIPSLDSANERMFRKINRPHPDLNLKQIISGISEFKRRFTGKLALEIFLLPNFNDTPEEIQLLIEATQKISPDEIQLNSLDRPGILPDLLPLSPDIMTKIAKQFESSLRIPTKVVSRMTQSGEVPKKQITSSLTARILNTLKRRPSDVQELSQALQVDPQIISNVLTRLESNGAVMKKIIGNRILFMKKRDT